MVREMMNADDMAKMSELLERADRVITLRQRHDGDDDPRAIIMRHDVDDGGWAPTMAMAYWEAERGYRSTYYFLPTAPYWGKDDFKVGLLELTNLGHEIGYHNNSLAECSRTREDPIEHLKRTVAELREWSGQQVLSTAAHGDPACNYGGFVNYQIFTESVSPHILASYKTPEALGITTAPLSSFGFEFQGDWIARPYYLTDSGGTFDKYYGGSHPYVLTLERALEGFPLDKQLSILQHPDHWPVSLFS